MPKPLSPAAGCPGLVSVLVLRCARDDRDALGTLVDLLYAPVAATVGEPGIARDDLVAEVFHTVWRRAHAFRRDDDAVAWVLDLARSTARRYPAAVAV
ncbi:MAG: sigma factor [Nocardioides sp.]|nr:sigma factor [Nocardioides sp.]